MNEMWNKRYADKRYAYGTAPNRFFKQYIENQRAGKLLLPAEGEGRNAVYAASIGWDVHAFDISEEGKKKALSLARKQDVNIHYEVTNAQDFVCPADIDLIALIYAHFDGPARHNLFEKLIGCLNPGGYWLMEVFSKKQLGKSSGGPKTANLLYSIEEIRRELSNLEISLLEERVTNLDEGPYHQGPAEVLRVIARKT